MENPGGRILIVDDNKINRMMLQRAVEGEGHQATTAEDGRQGLEMLRSADAGPFDVILLDILMPVMDGYEVLEIVKNDPELSHIPVIMISALDELDSVIRCIEMGATDYLTKPFKPALLRARLNASLSAKRLRDLELEYLEEVGRVVNAAEAVEQARFNPESLAQVAEREDALGQLARVFQRMAQEVYLREQRLKQQLQRLRLDMDEMKNASTEPLSVYLPIDRRQALAKGQSLPERTHGAALFADISGFTPLTGALAQELGLKQGAEELTRLLNQVYGALIAEVHRYGGTVIGFSGDAISCWFDRDEGLRALACGLAMQEAMTPFDAITTSAGSHFSLGIKVAVVTGPVRRFMVGDPEILLLDTLAGQTLDHLATAEHYANRGEVIIPEEMINNWPDHIKVSGWHLNRDTGERYGVISELSADVEPTPWPTMPPDALDEERCRSWLLPPVYEQIRSGTGQFLADLRPAAALFLKFEGLDYDGDEDAGQKLDIYLRWVQSILQRYDGYMIQLTIGDKGSYLYAAFGAPIAHNDDAVRAVYAGLELQSQPPEMNFITQVRLGISQGQLWAGAYGSSERRTYGAIGEHVNLAARLMQAAEGNILCDETIFQAAQRRLVFESLPPIKVKGKEEPMAVYRPTGEKKRFARRTVDLVGRTAERVVLRVSLQQLQKNGGQVLVLEGEAGIGKSRLLEELKHQAEDLSYRIVLVAGEVGLQATPLAAWREAFQAILELDPKTEFTAQEEQVNELLASYPEHQEHLALLNPILPFDFPESESTKKLTEQSQAEKRIALLTDILKAALDGDSSVILLENGQNLDPDSWKLALAIARQVQPLLMVIATRPVPQPIPQGYARLQQLPTFQMLLPRSLTAEQAYLLACQHLGVVCLPNPLVDMIQEAAGNPFVIEELIYLLRDEGTITVSDSRCQMAPDFLREELVFPTTAQGVITSRIDQLSPSEQLVLKVASVIGERFPLQLLNEIFPVAADRPYLSSHLKTLLRLDLIEGNESSESYSFKNTQVREAAYNTLLFVQRRHLHREVAEWLEANTQQDSSDQYASLARHWRLADEPSKAVEYLEKAGQNAKERGAYQEAESFFKQSLELESRLSLLNERLYVEEEAPLSPD